MKATVLAESSLYFNFSSGSFCSNDVYRCESGRCCTFPFFLTFFYVLWQGPEPQWAITPQNYYKYPVWNLEMIFTVFRETKKACSCKLNALIFDTLYSLFNKDEDMSVVNLKQRPSFYSTEMCDKLGNKNLHCTSNNQYFYCTQYFRPLFCIMTNT